MRENRFIKSISLLLAFIFLFGSAVTAWADEAPIEGEPVEEEITEQAVARLYICYHRQNKLIATGHVFLYVENLSDETLTVGVYDLPPNEGVSLGSFGFTRSDGFGIYYNTESYLYYDDGCEILCLSDELTNEELAAFSHRLLYSNTWDVMFYNCVSFAFMLWNTVAKPFLMPLLLPAFARLQIKQHGGTALSEMFFPPRERVYRLRGTGSGCYLEPVSDKSINK